MLCSDQGPMAPTNAFFKVEILKPCYYGSSSAKALVAFFCLLASPEGSVAAKKQGFRLWQRCFTLQGSSERGVHAGRAYLHLQELKNMRGMFTDGCSQAIKMLLQGASLFSKSKNSSFVTMGSMVNQFKLAWSETLTWNLKLEPDIKKGYQDETTAPRPRIPRTISTRGQENTLRPFGRDTLNSWNKKGWTKKTGVMGNRTVKAHPFIFKINFLQLISPATCESEKPLRAGKAIKPQITE